MDFLDETKVNASVYRWCSVGARPLGDTERCDRLTLLQVPELLPV